jgi:hypothetical protein
MLSAEKQSLTYNLDSGEKPFSTTAGWISAAAVI